MEKQHVLVLLETISNNIDFDFYNITYEMTHSGKKLRYVKYENARGWVKVDYNPNYLELTSQVVATAEKPLLSTIRFNYFTKHFSKIYRKWRQVGRKIERIDKIEQKIQKELEERENDELFNRSYYELFPENIERFFLEEGEDE